MRGVFADPKTDFVFKRVFGIAEHKSLLVALLDGRWPEYIGSRS